MNKIIEINNAGRREDPKVAGETDKWTLFGAVDECFGMEEGIKIPLQVWGNVLDS